MVEEVEEIMDDDEFDYLEAYRDYLTTYAELVQETVWEYAILSGSKFNIAVDYDTSESALMVKINTDNISPCYGKENSLKRLHGLKYYFPFGNKKALMMFTEEIKKLFQESSLIKSINCIDDTTLEVIGSRYGRDCRSRRNNG